MYFNFELKGKRNRDFVSCPQLREVLSTPNGLSRLSDKDKFSLHLAFILGHCSSCKRISQNNPCSPCKGSGCYLQELGFDLSNPNSIALLSHMCQTAFLCGRKIYDAKEVIENSQDLVNRENQLQLDLEKLKHDKEELQNGQSELVHKLSELDKEKKAVKEKRDKLGRPSKFDKRRMDYERYWFQANPKPTMQELADKIGVSRKTAYTDIQGISKEKKNSTTI